MASVTKLSQQLHRVASQWPVDPFRSHLQLGTFLKALADHPQLTPQATRAARALLESEYAHKYPLSEKIMKPASMPQYYTRLAEGYEKSAQGIARPWWKVFFGIW